MVLAREGRCFSSTVSATSATDSSSSSCATNAPRVSLSRRCSQMPAELSLLRTVSTREHSTRWCSSTATVPMSAPMARSGLLATSTVRGRRRRGSGSFLAPCVTVSTDSSRIIVIVGSANRRRASSRRRSFDRGSSASECIIARLLRNVGAGNESSPRRPNACG